MRTRKPGSIVAVVVVLALVLAGVAVLGGAARSTRSATADAAVLPPGFNTTTTFSGLALPTVFRFAPDGRVFVGEKDGVVKVFSNLSDTTPSVFADLENEVYSFVDRGLLGLAVDPQWPVRPYVYVMYSYDHILGDPAPPPKWGDTCAGSGSGVDNGNCTASARVSRLTADATLERIVPGSEKALVEDWCQQFPIHINGGLTFGSDGALYASHGTAAAAHFTDYGQTGSPINPCGDPPVPVGAAQTIPTAEGGSLRAQDPLTPNDPYTLDGTVIRVDPDTGAGLPGNPLFASADANARRIVAFGLRMPFRIAPRPGANEIWVGDVGEDLREEIDRVTIGGALANAGWPCYEADHVSTTYAPLDMCKNLTALGPGAVLQPYWHYTHNTAAYPGDQCSNGSSSSSGLAFYPGGAYPARYDNALFSADYARKCIYALLPGSDGLPDPTKVETLVRDQRGMTDIEIGPGGDLYFNDIIGGTISRLAYSGPNRPPDAVITADRTNGPAPLTVHFNAGSSTDPDGDPLHYEWDLDGDGQYDDSTSATPQRTYAAGAVDVRLRAIDAAGLAGTATQRITSGNSAPLVAIDLPQSTQRWSVGDTVQFSASNLDLDEGVLPASAYSWSLTLEHCPGTCHEHPSGTWNGIKSGSFATSGHEFPSFLALKVTVTDGGGLATSAVVHVFPNVSTVNLTSDPTGMTVDARGAAKTPFTRSVITGDLLSVTAADQGLGFLPMEFDGWSDLGAASHDIVVSGDRTLTAFFSVRLLRIPDRVVTEPQSATTVNVPVVVNRISHNALTVKWTATAGTAGAADVGLGSGTVTIPAGSDRGQIPITIQPDALVEGTESFTITLSDPTKSLVRDASGQVQIVDNDGPAVYTYIPKFSGDWADVMARAAAKLGVQPREIPKMGASLLRFIVAVSPPGTTFAPLSVQPPGDYEYTATYTTAAERDGIVADAARFGVNGTQLHTNGAMLLTYLVLLNP